MLREEVRNMSVTALPQHIAIIMDGNGRWAERRGLPRTAGHRAGLESMRRIVQRAVELKINYLTLYAFSTENWSRPVEEIDFLMSLPGEFWRNERASLSRQDVRLQVLGNVNDLPITTRIVVREAIEATRGARGMTVNLALNYGGRDEILRASRTFAETYGKKGTEADFAACLYTAGVPDPDLLIRPGGEMRISNFLLWQLAYTEFVFLDKLWPDFDAVDLDAAIREFQGRHIRRGGL